MHHVWLGLAILVLAGSLVLVHNQNDRLKMRMFAVGKFPVRDAGAKNRKENLQKLPRMRYLHHCCSHGSPSPFPSILTLGQWAKK
ncbi:hypothetical protein bcgnr5379_60720 [Bacillus cereus]